MNDVTHFEDEKKKSKLACIFGFLFINFLLLVLNTIYLYFIYDELTGFVFHF